MAGLLCILMTYCIQYFVNLHLIAQIYIYLKNVNVTNEMVVENAVWNMSNCEYLFPKTLGLELSHRPHSTVYKAHNVYYRLDSVLCCVIQLKIVVTPQTSSFFSESRLFLFPMTQYYIFGAKYISLVISWWPVLITADILPLYCLRISE